MTETVTAAAARWAAFFDALSACPRGCPNGYVYVAPTYRPPAWDEAARQVVDPIGEQVDAHIARYQQEAAGMLAAHMREGHVGGFDRSGTCDASRVTPGLGKVGPCILRYQHDGPVHRDAAGAEWWPTAAEPEFPLPVRPDGTHYYVSTYCVHGDHGACRRTCKTCSAECACDCGHPEPAGVAGAATGKDEPRFAEGHPVPMPVMDAAGQMWLNGKPWPPR